MTTSQRLTPTITVLVLDDSEVCLGVAREALEREGFEVVTSTSPLGASRLLRQSKAACVVVDLSMPALDGDKLVEILRRSTERGVRILLHSDRPKAEIESRARACGADAAVAKTPDSAQLAAAVRRVLRL